jgi:hypothetical protein
LRPVMSKLAAGEYAGQLLLVFLTAMRAGILACCEHSHRAEESKKLHCRQEWSACPQRGHAESGLISPKSRI